MKWLIRKFKKDSIITNIIITNTIITLSTCSSSWSAPAFVAAASFSHRSQRAWSHQTIFRIMFFFVLVLFLATCQPDWINASLMNYFVLCFFGSQFNLRAWSDCFQNIMWSIIVDFARLIRLLCVLPKPFLSVFQFMFFISTVVTTW